MLIYLNGKLENLFELLDLDTITYTTFGYASSCTNIPNGVGNGWFQCISFQTHYLCIQFYYPYNTHSIYVRQRLENGIWSDWESFVRTSDLGYVDCTVEAEANSQKVIPDSPSSKFGWIPVVTGHYNTNSVIETVFYDSGHWSIYSTVSQTTYIRFYKYPV